VNGAGSLLSMYSTSRYFAAAPLTLVPAYSVPLSAGAYMVRLHFAEVYIGTNTVGARVYDIVLEGQTVSAQFDVVAVAGYRMGTARLLLRGCALRR
jgi:hypothetical protein